MQTLVKTKTVLSCYSHTNLHFLFSIAILLFLCVLICDVQALDSGLELVITADTPWIISKKQLEPVRRALDDVRSDWYKVFGKIPIIREELPDTYKGPVIYIGHEGAWRESMVQESFSGSESFILRIQRDCKGRMALVATGADMRGSIYAAYALSEEILEVDPWYYWTDHEPRRRSRISIPIEFNKEFGPPTFKYRGWFINDEDLLNKFSPDPLKENVFSLKMFDKIYETLLRLRGNLIVPATFPFPDERCQELAARRGLILNMHHILVVGLNTFRWPENVQFSYSRNPDLMEHYWKTCIEAFKDYEVVWTVGYRGTHDHPFWRIEPEFDTPGSRGALITKAIERQVELIREVQPDADIISNLWMEGVELMHEGHLELPEGVILVWADDGSGIIRDKGRVQAGEGVYYHTMMLNYTANQLTEMVNPGRIYNQLGRFVKADATKFFLVNVSDIRPVPLSTDCAMKFVWNSEPYQGRSDAQNMDNFFLDWSRRQFGRDVADKVSEIYKQYFEIPYMRDDMLQGENILQSKLRTLAGQTALSINENRPLSDELMKLCRDYLKFSTDNRVYVTELLEHAESVFPQIPDTRKDFYMSHVLTQIQIHLHSLGMLKDYCKSMIAYYSDNQEDAIKYIKRSIRSCEEVLTSMNNAEYGKWSGWYMGECLVDISGSYDLLRILLAQYKGTTIPPIRQLQFGIEDVFDYIEGSDGLFRLKQGFAPRWEEIYKYQEPFLDNFPLLYPKK